MSIFKSQGVVIKIKKISEKNILYTIITSEYGKILCNKKFTTREKSLDLGFLINFEIDVKRNVNIHNIKNIKILDQFDFLGKKFFIIENFLILLKIIHSKLPEKLINQEIYKTLEKIVRYKNINSEKLILSQLKILNILGILDIENNNSLLKKILYFINKNKIENILKLTGINEKLENDLKNIVDKLISDSISNSF